MLFLGTALLALSMWTMFYASSIFKVTQGVPIVDTMMDFLQCNLCDTKMPEGRISDCRCDFSTVDHAVKNFYVPLLGNITSSAYFRYFRVDLEGECPFWAAPNQCAMEKCSVCPCDEGELPKSWVEATTPQQLQWQRNDGIGLGGADDNVNPYMVGGGDETANDLVVREVEGRQSKQVPSTTVSKGAWSPSVGWGSAAEEPTSSASDDYPSTLQRDAVDDPYDWIDLDEDEDDFCMPQIPDSHCEDDGHMGSVPDAEGSRRSRGVYVNLLENSERYTGYRGESAGRVWRAIMQENCFSTEGAADVCLEKRTFYRLISGLRASITTHIAREFYFHDDSMEGGHWGVNVPFFVEGVGRFPERLDNLYFTFLFLLRAVGRLQYLMPTLVPSLNTGNVEEDSRVASLLQLLVHSAEDNRQANALDNATSSFYQPLSAEAGVDYDSSMANRSAHSAAIEQCRLGFDETHLFQVPTTITGSQYWDLVEEKAVLLREFRTRFRNITRIMNCVTCEKCKLWGKLQILGIGTGIKLLLLSEEDLQTAAAGAISGSVQHPPSRAVLNRQELIALVNTLHQIAKSVEFAQAAGSMELDYKLGGMLGFTAPLALFRGAWSAVKRLSQGEMRQTVLVTGLVVALVLLMGAVYTIRLLLRRRRSTHRPLKARQ